MMNSIRETDRQLMQPNTFYETIKVLADGHPDTDTEAEPLAGKSKVLELNQATA